MSPVQWRHARRSPLGCEGPEATNKVSRAPSTTLYPCQSLKPVIIVCSVIIFLFLPFFRRKFQGSALVLKIALRNITALTSYCFFLHQQHDKQAKDLVTKLNREVKHPDSDKLALPIEDIQGLRELTTEIVRLADAGDRKRWGPNLRDLNDLSKLLLTDE